SLYILLSPWPPLSTPFPYTTLFRSVFGRAADKTAPFCHGRRALDLACRFFIFFKGVFLYGKPIQASAEQETDRRRRRPSGGRGGDRKSTRLNSSHVSISYAVFCLKK